MMAPTALPTAPRLFVHKPKVQREYLDGDYEGLWVDFLADPSSELLDEIFGHVTGTRLPLEEALTRVVLGWNYADADQPSQAREITPQTFKRIPFPLLGELWRLWNTIDLFPKATPTPSEPGAATEPLPTPPPAPASLAGPSSSDSPATSMASATPSDSPPSTGP